MRGRASNVAVLGCGLVGLACARALAGSGSRVTLVGERAAGEASPAAAGILAPSLDRHGEDVDCFARAARDLFPSLVAQLTEETGTTIALNRAGVLELAFDDASAERLAAAATEGEWLDATALERLEPALAGAAGALHHLHDGSVDNISLLHALRVSVASSRAIRRVDSRALALHRTGTRIDIITRSGEPISAEHVVVALGAWAPLLEGLPVHLPITPIRGQLATLAAAPLGHVSLGADCYLVPRPGAITLVGSTMEDAGFRIGTTTEATATLLSSARHLCPSLAHARLSARWSGIRPVTPDLLPIAGADPVDPRVIYACGHSRNGVLLAPLTGEAIAALVSGADSPVLPEAFSVKRFLIH